MNPNTIELLRMLEYRRPLGSDSLTEFTDRFVMDLPGAYRDQWGNVHVVIGDGARVLWSSHTDTVHHTGGKQTLHFDHETAIVGVSKRSKRDGSNCLGGDCTIGVWIMRNMIKAGVPGTYIFHHGEERGGIGSTALAKHHADWLSERFDFAIAFDRRRRRSVITHMSGFRVCSEKFAQSLIDAIGRGGLKYETDDGGSYTDTYEYAEIVPECTNISVGYDHEHRESETADLDHALAIMRVMCRIDVSSFVKDRDPQSDDNWKSSYTYGNGSYEYVFDPAFDTSARVVQFLRRGSQVDRISDDDVWGLCVVCGEHTWIDSECFTCIDCQCQIEAEITNDDEPRSELDRIADRNRSVYLDLVYEEVQNDLRAMVERMNRNGKA